MSRMSPDEIRQLTIAERVELAEQIWDSIVATPEALPIPEAQRQELDRRLKAHSEDPEAAQSWSSVRSRLTNAE
jgi:putative addiction module component (TIGR02574 family)